MEQEKGILIFAPCGSGKSTYLQKNLNINIVDGDDLLKEKNIKNRNYFWYGNYSTERDMIIETFQNEISKGINILYSGNPLLLKPDILVVLDKNVRKKRLRKRRLEGGFCPSNEQFENEESAYNEASKYVKTLRSFLSNIFI
jgi:hypothetical protein